MASRDSLKPTKAKSTDSLSPKQRAKQDYQRQRKRVQQAVHRATLKGYKTTNVSIPKVSLKTATTEQIKQVTRQLKKITPSTIRSESKADVSRETKTPYEPDNEQGFEEQQRQTDETNKERMESDTDFANDFTAGELTYQKIKGIIYQAYQAGLNNNYQLLEELLDNEIDTYGYESVMRSIGQANESEIMESAEIICFSSDRTEVEFNLSRIYMLITGTIPTAEQSKAMMNAEDADAYTESYD